MRSDIEIRTSLKIGGFLLDILGDSIPVTQKDGESSLILNRVALRISVHPWRENETFVHVQSAPIEVKQPSPNIERRLLEVNNQIARFGAFGIDNQGRVGVQAWLLGSSLDKETLRLTLQSISLLAGRATRLLGAEAPADKRAPEPLGQDIFGYQFDL